MNSVFDDMTDRAQLDAAFDNVFPMDAAREIKRRLAEEDQLRHLMVKRCVSLAIDEGTFALACRVAYNARHSGADPEQALQAGVRYAERHQRPRNPQPPKVA